MYQDKFNFVATPKPVDTSLQQRQLNFVKIVSHPTGGFTLAVPINQERGSGRIYHQWFKTEAAAIPSRDQHNQAMCRQYKENPVFKDCIEAYLAHRKALKTTVKNT